MSTRDQLIQALRDLCSAHGGYKTVADRAGVDDQSIYQIISGVRLPSGNPKGVGPTLQRKLDEAFPGWFESSAAGSSIRHDGPVSWPFKKVQQSAISAIPPSQLAALDEVLAAAVAGMSPVSRWRTVARDHATHLDHAIRSDPGFQLGADPFSTFVLQVDELAQQADKRTVASAIPQ